MVPEKQELKDWLLSPKPVTIFGFYYSMKQALHIRSVLHIHKEDIVKMIVVSYVVIFH